MPFKFHLKKSRQYNVVSKHQYVVSVKLLDHKSVECTLEIDSLGVQCLDYIIQRLGLGQTEFFGLKYICRHGEPTSRWIDMDKPLKKQLEKEAKNFHLYFGVRFHIDDVQFIHDNRTRYQYYLKLKGDVLDGRVQCNPRQAILLASYAMQAESGDYDPVRHQPENIDQLKYFPKEIIESEMDGNDSLLNSTIYQYKGLGGVTETVAQELYISIVIQLEGYGYETFTAKDDTNNDVLLGISINGIMIGYSSNQIQQFYRWKDISNVINHKKILKIECQLEQEESKQFVFRDSKSAKYLWQFCIEQHRSYMRQQEFRPSERLTGYFDSDTTDSTEQPDQATSVMDNRIAEEDIRWTSCNNLSTNHQYSPVVSASSNEINNLKALLPTYRPAPDYETAIQMKYNNGNPPQPYYANQSTIVSAELSCLLNNAVNRI